MFRLAGRLFRELWCIVFVFIFVIASARGDLAGTWMEDAITWSSLLLLVWIVLFAIGVSRGEPNP